MAVSPDQVEYLAAQTADLYADAETRLFAIIARQLAAGLESPGWAAAKLAAIQPLRRAAGDLLDSLAGTVSTQVRDAVAEAYNSGRASALDELGGIFGEERRTVLDQVPGLRGVDRLAAETIALVTDTHRSILRAVDDGYRAVVSEVTGTPLLGIDTRRQATQEAMRRFAGRGIVSFRDRAGRPWSMTSYAEMAVRTSVGRAAVEAHMTTLSAAGVDLVIVSNSPRECPLCRPWERRVLTIGGPSGARTIEVEHATDDGRMVRVHVAGTLDDARRAGLQHPNCRHSVSAYAPGLTPVGDATPDPDGYEAGQRQREIERHIRRWKTKEAAAVTPEGRKAAGAKVRQWQAAMRDHLAEHPDLRRLRAREQPGASNLPSTAPRPSDVDVQAARVRAGDTATVREMTDDQLAAALRARASDDRDQARVLDELDRRYPPEVAEPADTGDAAADLLADRDALADAMAPAPDPDEWGALADDTAFAAEATKVAEAAEDATPRTITRREARALYDEYVYRQYLAAEDACRGYLLSKRAEAEGIDPVQLFSGPARIAHARASDELREWWQQHGRLTQAEFIEHVTGQTQRWAAGARKNESDHQNKR
ncbi:phage capsid protein [Streptomyces sp. ME02-6991-2B]|nr:phage capsid protein [Streptomyces sp. ME02-6991-2B]